MNKKSNNKTNNNDQDDEQHEHFTHEDQQTLIALGSHIRFYCLMIIYYINSVSLTNLARSKEALVSLSETIDIMKSHGVLPGYPLHHDLNVIFIII